MFQGNDMDSSRGVLSGTMDRFKTVCTRNNIFPIPINIDLSAVHHLFFSFVFFPICLLIYFRIKHVLLLGCYDDLVLPCRYLRPSRAEECLHLWHHLSWFSLSYTISLGNQSVMGFDAASYLYARLGRLVFTTLL
jgi:hypothetical protein